MGYILFVRIMTNDLLAKPRMSRQERLEELFQEALERDSQSRAEYLRQKCQDDPRLLAELQSLLDSDTDAAGKRFLSSSAVEVEAVRAAERRGIQPGQTLGAYRIVDLISSGGMGSVYLAVRDDAEYQKKVAIKVIKRGMDTDLIVSRFRNERQILAHLEHPNIAHLLDGGTTEDGLPYLVMEYIEGLPLDQYADEHKLNTTARLRLFFSICSAVHYAHQNLVVHRDLKPSNILVTKDGVPKLLDFGVAKLLSPDESANAGDRTMTALSFVTPEYASPEQVRGEAITTLSDIYSLGVVLYRLLTGFPPYRVETRSFEQMSNAICHQEPEKPSAIITRRGRDSTNGEPAPSAEDVSATREGDPLRLRRRLRGDLDNIVLMALRKEPERRYTSAEQFADDIRHHLDGLPVIAQRGTLAYLAGKFVRRHAVAAVAAVLVLISLVAGIAATAWEAHVARLERARAERRFNDIRKLANSFLFEFHDSIQEIPGTLAARQMVVERALQYLDSLAMEAGSDKSLHEELGRAYERVGSLTFDTTKALEIHRKALAINEWLVRVEPANRGYREQLGITYGTVANVLKELGDSPGSLQNYRKSAEILESLVAADPKNPEYSVRLAESYDWMGVMLVRLGQDDEALKYHYKALALRTPLLAANPENIENRRAVMMSDLYVADRLSMQGDDRAALERVRAAAEIPEALHAGDLSNVVYRRDLWLVNMRMARIFNNLGDPAGAAKVYQKALTLIDQLSLADPGDQGHRHGVAFTCLALAGMLAELNRVDEALANDNKAVAISKRILAADPGKTEARLDLAQAYSHLGNLYLKTGSLARAAEDLSASRAGFEAEAKRDPKNVDIQRQLAAVYSDLGHLRVKQAAGERAGAGKQKLLAEARDLYQHSLDIWTALRTQSPSRRGDEAEHVARALESVGR